MTSDTASAVVRFLRRWAPVGLYLFGSAFLLAESASSTTFAAFSCLALLPLFVVIRSCGPTRVVFLAGFWGAAYCLMLIVCGSPSFELTWSAALALILLPALFAFVSRQAIERLGCSMLLLPTGWALLNIGSHCVGLQAGLLSGLTLPGSIFSEVAGFGGWAIVALIIAAINACLALVISGIDLRLVRASSPDLTSKLQLLAGRYSESVREFISFSPIKPRGPPDPAVADA